VRSASVVSTAIGLLIVPRLIVTLPRPDCWTSCYLLPKMCCRIGAKLVAA
jgi:hypothetical protein